MIDPLETDFSRYVGMISSSTLNLSEFPKSSSKPPNRWKHYTHPDGGIYFLNESWVQFFHQSSAASSKLNSQQVPVITDVYIDDDDSRQHLEAFVEKIFTYIESYEVILPAGACLVLEFRQSGRCGYYFVDHAKRCLFWLEEFDAMVFLDQVRVKFTPPLVGQEMKSLYWYVPLAAYLAICYLIYSLMCGLY